MPESLCRLLLHIHAHTQLAIEHGGQSRHTGMQRGLRQGCSVAPMIYACWTIRLCKVLDSRMRSTDSAGASTWTQNHMSIFADDKHCHWELDSCRSLRNALKQLRIVFSTITELGMQISIQKCLATIALKGTRAAKMMAKYFKNWNGQQCLVLREHIHDIHIPVTHELKYLGVILSYGNFEIATAKHRIHQANINYAQLRPILRTNGPLSQARRRSVYRTCVWTSLLYGVSATGVNDSVYRLLQSTAATHLRKVLRVHEKGRSNESVLQQADLTLLQHIQQQVSGQGLTLQQDHQRAPQLRTQEDVRHQQIQEQLAQLRHHGVTRVLVPQDPTQIAQIPCPVCGIEYANKSGLHQHLHRSHPEIEQASKIQFKRSEHSLFGLPFCRFCRSRQGTWSALIKHVTQGMCLRIKLAMCRSQTIDQLMQEIIDEEYMDPPQLPEGAEHQLDNNIRKSTLLSHLLNIDPKDLHQHSDALLLHSKQCYLCGQLLRQASRIKSHWRQSHPQAWRQAGPQAMDQARSLSALFTRPCRYCGSTARNSTLHAQQCPVMFQVLAYRRLMTHSTDEVQNMDQKKPQHRKTEAPAAYKSFISPMQTALQRGARQSTSTSTSTPTMSSAQRPKPEIKPLIMTPRTVAEYRHSQATRGTIAQYFRHGAQQPSAPTLDMSTMPWTCRLHLRNPQALCYVNAGILALLHCLVTGTHNAPELQFLIKVGENAANRARQVLLSQMNMFRQLTPDWRFTSEQQDTAEYLHALFSHTISLQAIWDSRTQTADGIRLRTQGMMPIAMPLRLEGEPESLQVRIQHWHESQDITALTVAAPVVCIQLGRYVDAGKLRNQIDLPEKVQIPIFDEVSRIEWREYSLVSAIIHLGRSTRVGHYRAILRVGSLWFLTDDHKQAEPLTVHEGHLRNIYVLMLCRCDPADAGTSASPHA